MKYLKKFGSFITVIGLSLITITVRGQDISGIWLGSIHRATPPPGVPNDAKIKVKITTTADAGNYGEMTVSFYHKLKKRNVEVTKLFTIDFIDDKIIFQDQKIMDLETPIEGFYWCINRLSCDLFIDKINKTYTLAGGVVNTNAGYRDGDEVKCGRFDCRLCDETIRISKSAPLNDLDLNQRTALIQTNNSTEVDISGTWKGTYHQFSVAPTENDGRLILKLTQEGKKIYGTYQAIVKERGTKKEVSITSNITGDYNNGLITFRDAAIVGADEISNGFWCLGMSSGKLVKNVDQNSYRIEGATTKVESRYVSGRIERCDLGNCSQCGGEFIITKEAPTPLPQIKFRQDTVKLSNIKSQVISVKDEIDLRSPVKLVDKRKVIVKQQITSTSEILKCYIRDYEINDGDIVSMKLNEKWVIRNIEITKENQTPIFIKLKKGENLLSMYAENLGISGINTAYLLVFDKDKQIAKIKLDSDYTISGGVIIKY